jgi:hypothetical protein
MDEITGILDCGRSVAVVGCSPNAARESHRVARYLQAVGYRVIPVNPNASEILGERCYPTLDAIPEPIDWVDVFRRSEEVPDVAEAALRRRVRGFWMQLGVRHPESAARLRAAGVMVVEDHCTAIEHRARV